jgi:hypothetical protein
MGGWLFLQELRVALLSRTQQIQYLGAPLRYLNGTIIDVSERVRALEAARVVGFDEIRIRTFRAELALEAVKAKPTSSQIILSSFGLKLVHPVAVFKNLEFLDLSDNFLETLVDQGLETLPKL